MRFLAATDLSEAGLLGVEAISLMRAPQGDKVTLLHVVDLDLYTAGGSVPGIIEFAEERLGPEAERLRACGLDVTVRVEQGDSAQTIRDVAAEEDSDLVVMTSLGKGAKTGRLMGSAAEKVASAGTVPVLVERVHILEGEACCRVNAGSPFERVLIAADLDEAAVSVVALIDSLSDVGATRVLHVAPDADAVAEARKRLRAMMDRAPTRMKAEADVMAGDPARVILDTASEWKATTIALNPCAHGMLHRAIWGSTAREVALHAHCSVLFVPPTKGESDQQPI